MMPMSALAAGRGVSLPSMGCAAICLAAHTTGAYSRIRRRFNLPTDPIATLNMVKRPMAQASDTPR
jgi:acyl-CoA dehydrogenase